MSGSYLSTLACITDDLAIAPGRHPENEGEHAALFVIHIELPLAPFVTEVDGPGEKLQLTLVGHILGLHPLLRYVTYTVAIHLCPELLLDNQPGIPALVQ